MKRKHLFTLLGVVIVLVGVFILLQSQNSHPRKWYTCNQSSDCIKVSGVCGDIDSINSEYQNPYEKQTKELAKTTSCMEKSVAEKIKDRLMVPACVKNRCKAVSASEAL